MTYATLLEVLFGHIAKERSADINLLPNKRCGIHISNLFQNVAVDTSEYVRLQRGFLCLNFTRCTWGKPSLWQLKILTKPDPSTST
jgi:hypothetical protein